MRRWIRLPLSEGTATRQAHCDLPPETYEREFGREGFFGPSTQMLHKHPPTSWKSWEGPLRPRAFDMNALGMPSVSPWAAPEVLYNDHLRIRYWRGDGKMDHLVRNGDGDDLLFIHEGAGDLFCDYGHLPFRDGDYIVMPRGTCWRIEPSSPVSVLMVEASNDAYQLPEKGIVGNQAIFDPGVLDYPHIDDAFKAQQTEDEWSVVIKKRNALSTVTFPFNPLDAVGWHGEVAPVRLNWRDLRPITSARYHIPPSAHVNFVAARFVIGTFAPRPIETDPGALKVPYFHNNDDYDEMIFIHRGQMFSRDNFGPGMIGFNPSGFAHGPQPKAFEIGKKRAREATDEVVLYVDARDAMEVAELPEGVEVPNYADSWQGYPQA
ncbi:MAG: homogentisate 1,2-dioxygenase [Candidatus Binataceae bacterium]|nr:homogentisate 1,2-dioxygenase [Candidatus Binataceae bacterium]